MLKRCVTVMAILALMAALAAACSSGNGDGDGDGSNGGTNGKRTNGAGQAGNGANTPAASVPDNEAAGGKDREFTIRVGAWFLDDRQFMQDFRSNVEAAYKQLYPNASIQWDVLLGAQYFDKLKAEFASNTAPDVIFQNTTGAFAEAGYLADLSGEEWAGKLHGGSLAYAKSGGKVYGLPMGMDAQGIWYNKSLFTELGLSAPQTWEQFTQVNEAVKAAGITPIALGFKDLWTATMIVELMGQSIGYESSPTFGEDLYSGAKALDGAEMQQIMGKIQDFRDKGFFNANALSIDWPQSGELFTSGKAAMIIQGAWMPGTAQENFATKGHGAFELGYFPMMSDSGYRDIRVNVGAIASVNAESELIQEAKDLIAVIASEPVYAPYNLGNGSIPAIAGIQAEFTDPALVELQAALGEATSSLGYMLYIPESSLTVLSETLAAVVSGVNFDPKQLEDAQKVFERDKDKVILPEV